MNAYLIDPAARTISVVDTDFSLQHIYSLLGCGWITTAAGQLNGDIMYVGDNVSDDENEAFRFGVWEIYSKALVVGTDEEGENVSPRTPIELYDSRVHWLGLKSFEPKVEVLSWEDFNRVWPSSISN